jgi:hypothetical protein
LKTWISRQAGHDGLQTVLIRRHKTLTQRQLEELVSGPRTTIREQARSLALDENSPVKSRPGARGSIEYFWEESSAPQPPRPAGS